MKFFESYLGFGNLNEAAIEKIGTWSWHSLLDGYDTFYADEVYSIDILKKIGFIDDSENIKSLKDFYSNYILNSKSIYFDQRYLINKDLYIHDKKDSKHLDNQSEVQFIASYLYKGHFSKSVLKKFKTPKDVSYSIGIEKIKTFLKNIKILESFLKKYGLESAYNINYVYCTFSPVIDEHIFQSYPPSFAFNEASGKIHIDEADADHYEYGYKPNKSRRSGDSDGEGYTYGAYGFEEIPTQLVFNLSNEEGVVEFFQSTSGFHGMENTFKQINLGKLTKLFKDYPKMIYEIIDEEVGAYIGDADFNPRYDKPTYPNLVSFLLMGYEELESYIRTKFKETGNIKKIIIFAKTLTGKAKNSKFSSIGGDFDFFED